MISVIIPVYNSEKFIAKAIESVLYQTFKDFELILINDGSSDSSGKICNEYSHKDSRIRVFHQENKGQAATRNLGLNYSVGEYVYFMDNDDILLPNALEVMITNIIEVDADVCSCQYLIDNGNLCLDDIVGMVECNTLLLNNEEAMEWFLQRKINIYIWTKLYKKKFLDYHSITFEVGRSDEDFLFNTMVFEYAKKILFVDKKIYIYRERPDSTCRTFPKIKLDKFMEDTWYRITKIENIIKNKYPSLLYLAKIQSLLYCFSAICVFCKNSKVNYHNKYYLNMYNYLRNNKQVLLRERKIVGISLKGFLTIMIATPQVYFCLKKD